MSELLGRTQSFKAALSEAASQRLPGSDAELVDVIRALEELKSAAAALQARAAADLASSREQALGTARTPKERVAARRLMRSAAPEVALARRESPHRGGRLLGLAKALTSEMPHTYAALQQGLLNEWRATLVARETACLSMEDRGEVDRALAADAGEVEGWGDRRLADQVRTLAYRLDPHAVVDRARRARAERHVSLRPAPDTMTWLTALLPVEQGVACWAALKASADGAGASGDERSRGQVMADTLYERVTGRAIAGGVGVEVKLVLTDRTLLQGESEPARLEGYGTLPAQIARDLARHGAETGAGAFVRQIYTHPVTGSLVAMASRRRTMPAGLAELIATRDQSCRTPWCDAPIRHRDHVWEVARGGPTSAGNGQGLCEACNHTKQADGWHARSAPGMRHLVVTRTPTGHAYRSTAPPPPGCEPSTGETYTSADLVSTGSGYRSSA
ncbi:MAG: DUF222 domain-containing protein [Marmoricola sp.]